MEIHPSEQYLNRFFQARNMLRSYKYRVYPSKEQERLIIEHLHLATDMWNELLAYSIDCYKKTGKFPSRFELIKKAKKKG